MTKIRFVVKNFIFLKKITESQKSLFNFKTDFFNKFEVFELKFSTFSDTIESRKSTNFFTNFNTKLTEQFKH